MGSLRNCPPLLNILLLPLSLALGAWNAFKIYPAVAYGLLALSSALVAKRVFGLNGHGPLMVSVVTTLFIINLRISWDYQRQLLGSVFMLLSIVALNHSGEPSGKRIIVSALLLICCALSHEVTAFFSAALSALLLLRSLKPKDIKGVMAGSMVLAVSISLEAWYWGKPYTPNVYFGVAPIGVVSYSASTMSEVISRLIAGFGLLLPFALLALSDRSSNPAFLKAGLASLTAAGLSPLFMPHTSVATWYRFLTGAAPLISTLAGSGMVRGIKDLRLKLIFILLLLMLAMPYAYGVSGTSRFTSALREFPSGLVPSPMNAAALRDLISLSEWFKEQGLRSTIIAEPGAAKWIHLAVRNPEPSELVWLWSDPISSTSVKSVLERLGVGKAYVVCGSNLEETEGIKVYGLRDGVFSVYMVELIEER